MRFKLFANGVSLGLRTVLDSCSKIQLAVVGLLLFLITFVNLERAWAIALQEERAQALSRELEAHAAKGFQERRYTDVLRSWYVLNHLKGEEHAPREFEIESDMRSLIWATSGQTGLCPTYFPKDEPGAGLWAVAVHNYIVRYYKRKDRKRPSLFSGLDSFEKGRQNVALKLESRPSKQAIQRLKFGHISCFADGSMPFPFDFMQKATSRERQEILSDSLIQILVIAAQKMNAEKIKGTKIVTARIIDLWLWQKIAEQGRPVFQAVAEPDAALNEFKKLLPEQWLSIERKRALRIFDVIESKLDMSLRQKILFAFLEKSLEDADARQVSLVLGRFQGDLSSLRMQAESGLFREKILQLDDAVGFSERSYFYFKMALEQEQQKNLQNALRSFAFALRYAPESSQAEEVTRLSLQWIAYLLAEYRVDEKMLRVLREVLPREHFDVVWKELTWASVMNLDSRSFELLMTMRSARGRMSADLRKFSSYAAGKAQAFVAEIKGRLESQPGDALRLILLFVQNLERQDFETRLRHRKTLSVLRQILEENKAGVRKAMATKREELVFLMESIESSFPLKSGTLIKGDEGIGDIPDARLNPDASVSAGAVRLPPETALPWPFLRGNVSEPDVFQVIDLQLSRSREKGLVWTLGDRL